MRKLLFISFQDFHHVNDGGSQANKRNAEMCVRIFGKENVDYYYVNNHNKRSNLLSLLHSALLFPFGYFNGLTPNKLQSIVDRSSEYDYIFVSTSVFGLISKKLKEHGYKGKIICFFHNVESFYYEARVSKKLPFRHVIIDCAAKNDQYSIRYADLSVGLCKRDSKIIKDLYGKAFDMLVPITFTDKCDRKPNDMLAQTSERPKCFFIGSNFPANSEGILWFVENVLPHVKIDFRIIGKDMDLLQASQPVLNNIPVFSNVPDLALFFEEADFMVFPIFSGSGMKVKTCEALMYGKNILGTTEAFEGYDLNTDLCGKLCNTAEDYIKAINYFSRHPIPKYNDYSRSVFVEKYSDDIARKAFGIMFQPK